MDISYLLFLQNIRDALGSGVEAFMGAVSAIGVHYLIILVPAILYWCINKKDGLFVFFTYSLGEFLNGIIKLSVCCYRPWIRDPRIIPSSYAVKGATGYSFPSGHSTVAGSVFVSAGWRLRNNYRHVVTIVFFVFSFLVMFSRNYLTVHTPQDVIVGMSLGIFSMWITTLFFNWIDKNEKKDIVSVIVALISIVLAILYFKYKSYPLDYAADGELLVDPQKMMVDSFGGAGRFAGLMIAWILERRFIKFSIDGSVAEKIVRLLVGVALVLAVNYLAVPFFTSVFPSQIAKFCRGFAFLFTTVFIVPCTFKPLSKLFNRK